jgi:hypothetical protein
MEGQRMSRREELLALAAKVEAAQGTDRALDMEIDVLLCRGNTHVIEYVDGTAQRVPYVDFAYSPRCECPRYTASLDAAVSLVPAGWRWSLDQTQRAPFQECGRADLYAPGDGEKPRDVCNVYAATPALALTAAALRALAEEAGE